MTYQEEKEAFLQRISNDKPVLDLKEQIFLWFFFKFSTNIRIAITIYYINTLLLVDITNISWSISDKDIAKGTQVFDNWFV